MKKKFATIALALVAAFGVSAMAQAPQKTTACDKVKTEHACDKPCGKHEHKGKMQKGEFSKTDSIMFAGIDLTSEQKAKIAAMREEARKVRQEARAEAQKMKQDVQKSRMEMRQEMQQKRDARVKAELAEMKKILTPEQYVQYLENMVVSGANRMEGMMKAPKGHDIHKGHAAKARKASKKAHKK